MPPVPPIVRSLAVAAATVTGVIIGPAVLVGSFVGPVAGAAFPLAAIAGLAAANGDGRGNAWQLLPLMGLGGAAVAATAGSWAWVAVLAIIGAVVGWLSTMGRFIAVSEVAIMVVSAGPQSGSRALLVYGAFSVLGYLYGVLAARVAGAPEFVGRMPPARIHPGRAALLGAAALALAAVLALQANWIRPFWIPAAFLALLQMWFTAADVDRPRVLVRLAATYIGVLLLVPLLRWVPSGAVGAAAVVILIVGIAVGRTTYWVSVALVTVAVVLFASGEANPLVVGQQRFNAFVVGTLLLVVVLAGLRWVRRPSGATVLR
jgi:hypothetical protein